MVKFDPQRHHRHSIRLPNYDYTQPGEYFITIVTYKRDLLFGEIVNEEMRLNDFGKIADECWREIPNHFPNVELGAYVVMPNHMHGIIIIHDARGTIYRAPSQEQFQKPVAGSIPTIVRTYKAAVTRRIGCEHNITGIWQRNYYEHVIRNEIDFQNKTDYIEANPLLWEQDNENPIYVK
jgi:REP element-mobilizing transposase RayT